MLGPKRLLRLPENLPPLVRWSAFFYLIHLVFQGKTAVSEISAGLAPLLLTWALAKRQIRPSAHVLYYPLALYGIASTISSLLAPRHIHSFGENMLWVKMLIFPTALILFREIPRMRELALYAHAVFVTWIASDGLIQFIFEGRRDLEHRITGTATHVMTFSGELMPLAILFAILWIHTRRHWMLVPAALSTLALLFTYTRSAWLAWVLAMAVVLLFTRPRWIAYAVPVAIVFLTFAPLPIFARFASVFDTKQESNFDRIRMVQAGVEIIRDYPLFGVGPANIKQIYPLYRMHDAPRYRVPHLHNNVVQIWAERGIVALGAYVLLLFFFLRDVHEPGRGRRAAGRRREWP